MKVPFFLSCLLFINIGQAQLLQVSAGTDLNIVSGTIFKADNFMLTPSANYTITNNTLAKSTTISHAATNAFISRVYQFSNNTNPFSGSLQINYTDGAELNGITEGALTLNIYNGTSWGAYAATVTRDGINNFILTNGLSSVILNEITLADLASPLPLVWLSFTATKQNQMVLLQWSTAQEQNTRNFVVQHSSNGIAWTAIGVLSATGSSSNYSFVHTTPIVGQNYYRILQTDVDNRISYSNLRTCLFAPGDAPFTIIANPVTHNALIVQVNTAAVFALYTNEGKLMWQERLHAGIRYIDVSRYAKGTYLLKANSTVQKVVNP